MSFIKVCCVQTTIFWESPKANCGHLEEFLQEKGHKIGNNIDLIILPEMFSTGFSMKVKKLAEFNKGYTQQWMKQMARRYDAVICGSIIFTDGKDHFNRFFWVKPDGTFETYDKKYGFSPAKEHLIFKSGVTQPIFSLKGFKILPQICYELRFPESSRNIILKNGQPSYDLALYIANWPTPRIHHWDSLLKARAIENQAYVIGSNAVFQTPIGWECPGHSKIIDPKGTILLDLLDHDDIGVFELSLESLHAYREKLPFIFDQK